MIYSETPVFFRVSAHGTRGWLWLFSCLLFLPVVGLAQDCITLDDSPANGDLQVSLTADKTTARTVSTAEDPEANLITYTIDIYNDSDFPMANIAFEGQLFDGNGEPLSADFFESYEISHNFQNASFALEQNPLKITGDISLEAQQRGELTVKVRLKEAPPKNTLIGRVNVFATGVNDTNMDNNWDTVETVVQSEGKDIMITKSTEDACLYPNSTDGNIITLSVTNTGTETVFFFLENIKMELFEDLPKAEGTITLINDEGIWDETYIYPNNKNFYFLKSTGTLAPGETISGSYRITYGNNYTYNSAAKVTVLSNEVNENNNVSGFLKLEEQQPNPPTTGGEVFYLQGEQSDFLTATGDDGNDLNWYYTSGGRAFPGIKPSTATAGPTTYFVSQSNNGCESDLAKVQVTVVGPEPGSIGGDQLVCKNTAFEIVGTDEAVQTYEDKGFTYTYEWKSVSPETGTSVWTTEEFSYSSPPVVDGTTFERSTIITRDADGKCTRSAPAAPITVSVKPCAVSTNPMMPSRGTRWQL